jgi:crossover junction endodeoxyribonuclease RuvC
VFVTVGIDVLWEVDMSPDDIINAGVRCAYLHPDNVLRASVLAVSDGKRANTKDNTPAVIHHKLVQMIEYYQPGELAIEAPFYGKNVQSMLKLGRAQGVAISAAMQFELPVFEYAPRKIKQSITGNGNASKEQVAAMLKHLIEYEEAPTFTDATDALATAICHQLSKQNPLQRTGSAKSWEQFIKQNPDKIG